MTLKPFCFVVMPFGLKPDSGGPPDIDFDRLYHSALKPAVEDAGMEPIRADEERSGGIIHKPMFERLLLCDYVLADLTTANVFYELGGRHTARPATTLTVLQSSAKPLPRGSVNSETWPSTRRPSTARSEDRHVSEPGSIE